MATPLLGLEEATVSVYVAANAVEIAKTHSMAMMFKNTRTFFIVFSF
jgi:hypothetical protein